jgi:hypothetical protein
MLDRLQERSRTRLPNKRAPTIPRKNRWHKKRIRAGAQAKNLNQFLRSQKTVFPMKFYLFLLRVCQGIAEPAFWGAAFLSVCAMLPGSRSDSRFPSVHSGGARKNLKTRGVRAKPRKMSMSVPATATPARYTNQQAARHVITWVRRFAVARGPGLCFLAAFGDPDTIAVTR